MKSHGKSRERGVRGERHLDVRVEPAVLGLRWQDASGCDVESTGEPGATHRHTRYWSALIRSMPSDDMHAVSAVLVECGGLMGWRETPRGAQRARRKARQG